MLERILKLLEGGPSETSVGVHGPTTQVVLKMQIIAADAIGIVARPKGMLGGIGEEKLYPWNAISFVNIPS